jgi:exonuclease III
MTIQQLTLVSLNICSLGQGILGIRRRRELRDFLNKAEPQPTIILLQEHHMSMEDCLTKTKQLDYKGGSSFWNHATYSARGDRYKGGTGIILGAKTGALVTDSKVIVEAQAQYVLIKINKQTIGILNIYAPNHTAARARFWNQIANHNFLEVSWIVGGDFNMTE